MGMNIFKTYDKAYSDINFVHLAVVKLMIVQVTKQLL
jgi:hypothetical protein